MLYAFLQTLFTTAGLVKSFSWIQFEKLSDVKDMIADAFTPAVKMGRMDDVRVNTIIRVTEERIHCLEQAAMAHHSSIAL